MCGFCGFINYSNNVLQETLKNMADVINYRGPDDAGYYDKKETNYHISLAHKRLSILDLTNLGHQPMCYENYVIVYNGEVYNFKEIRADLIKLGHIFKSNTDTEVILHAFSEWGMDCVKRFLGMFAFAIYNQVAKTIYFCRDRAGIKPFYYYLSEKEFVFGSELKCILQYPGLEKKIDYCALTSYFEFGYIPKEQCIISGVKKLDGGNWLIYDIENKKATIRKYWDIQDFYNSPKLSLSYEEAKEKLIDLFKSSFQYRLIADVPVGLALSGGYDSTLVASILVKELGVDLNTFTIGFEEGNNESSDAENISKVLGTKHSSYICTYTDVLNLIPNLQYFYDEPFADNSAIPTILVSKLAKEKVKVLLSADGGDELFAGYTHYDTCFRSMNTLNKIPTIVKDSACSLVKIGKKLLTEQDYRLQNLADRFISMKEDGKWNYKSYSDCVRSYPNDFLRHISLELGKFSTKKMFKDLSLSNDSLEYLLMKDYKFFMKDDVLVKVDRATMSVSIEGREPLLDHRIAEFAAQLPLTYKYIDGKKKRILKDIVHKYVPHSIMDKPKRGFSMPISNWMRGPLRDYLMDSLSESNVEKLDLNPKYINKILNLFLNDNFYYHEFVWRLLQYQNWHEKWIG